MPQLQRILAVAAVQIEVEAVSKQTLPWLDGGALDEATTLVAQKESCEAGVGRTVVGPTTPNKQRAAPQAAVLEHWERTAEAATTEDLALQRWDQGRLGLAAYGLNDQLVAKLAFKAEVSRARKTD